ncbi:outer membrane receptor protein [Tenacibaculum todarodis]|uniref:Outer membrane receptor protein n=1 Tax=Tenacibaculum todarodis TaxID=1850252 RepID=A0A1L3JI57_9FLAO|nr:TonB-dependent receptor [Tenacibaculum todarodis]APG64826.1 outer membrane receptor protein [Tenacibaculum todarodis]
MFLNRRVVLVAIFFTSVAFSQKNEKQKDSIKNNKLDEVIVTATRTVRQLSSVPMPVTLISKKQIQQSGSVRLSDILIEQTGITTASDFGGFNGVQMQGLDAEYTLILIDGVPLVGKRSGNIDLDRISVNNIKQIEIVKGPSSSLYGSDAIGGVINIITEKPKHDVLKGSLQFLARGGAKNELDMNANLVYKKDKLGINAGINTNSSAGFDLSPQTSFKTTNGHENYTGNFKVLYDFTDKLKTTVSTRFFEENQGNLTEQNNQKDWSVNVDLNHKVSDKWNLDYTFYVTDFNTKSETELEVSTFNQTLIRPEIRSQFSIGKLDAIVGVGASFEEVDRSDFLKKEKFDSQYVFGQLDYNPTSKLNVIIGARFDNHSQYKSAFSPKISTRYVVNNWLATKASVGYGFKAPDFRQLYFNFRNTASGYVVFGIKTLHELYGNLPEVQQFDTDLNPENSVGFNLGFELKPINNLAININVFRNDIEDLINTFDTQINPLNFNLPAGTRVFTYENRDKVYTQGFELDANYKIDDNFRFIAGYQFLEAKDKEEEALIKSNQIFIRRTPTSPSEKLTIDNYFGLPNRSKHMANAKLYYQNFEHRFSANLRAIYRSKYALYDTNNSQGVIDEYDDFVSGNITLNTAIEKKLFSLLKVQFGIDNLLDEKGESNATKQAFLNNDAALQLGRTYYGRIQFNF